MSSTSIDTTSYISLGEAESSKLVLTNGAAKMDFEAPSKDGKFMIFVLVSASATNEAMITVKAGDYWRKSLGDATLIAEAGTDAAYWFIGPLESARFKDDDGNINITIEKAATGAITVTHYTVGVITLK